MQPNMNIMDSLARLDELCPTGYAIALHIRFTTPRFLFQTYSEEWKKVYSEQGLVLKDPTVLWGFSNEGVVRWSDLADMDDAGMLDLAKQYGLNFGFTYATNDGDSKSIASFSSGTAEFSESDIAEASGLALGLHQYTANIDDISSQERDKLKDMSVDFTHS